MYTSGTESRPKGALLSSRSLLWEYATCIIDGEMSVDDVELHSLPLYHCAQLDCFLGPDVMLGATSVIARGPDPATLLRLFESEKITKFFAPPTVWIGLLRCPDFDGADLSSLRKGYYGASPMPVEVLHELRRRLPDVQFWNFYGQTEMAPAGHDPAPARAARARRVGRTRRAQRRDARGRRRRPAGAGRDRRRDRAPRRRTPRWATTSRTTRRSRRFAADGSTRAISGVLDADGYLTVVDRKKDVIKSGGENVASREVEEVIYAADGVAEVAVFGIPDPRWVETVVAAVVARPGADVTVRMT